MNTSKLNPITATAIKAEAVSAAGEIVLTIGTKYAREMSYAFPREALEGLLGELQMLVGASPATAPQAASRQAPGPRPAIPSSSGAAADAAKVTVRAPKRWMLGNGLPDHPMVVFIVDPQTDQQAGYAFDAKAAREMAVALVKNADAVTNAADKPRSASV